uniref:Uncharacterized protein n=1 Tax=Ditylum brightwellii TaxID=49249 RepID=A0A7S2ET96_9STRA|mmetsp:Transcript_5622/g.8532  ORF Transcript_5622/g.8532 Transcript_5622/m.8532 type:complete len:216 (+) Transcript_5622:3-650(+)
MAAVALFVLLVTITEGTASFNGRVLRERSNQTLQDENAIVVIKGLYEKQNYRKPKERNEDNPGNYSTTYSGQPQDQDPGPVTVASASNEFIPSDTKPICDSSGALGDFRGDINAISITYLYEVETDPSGIGRMENDILPAIEDAINDAIAPVLFSTCGDIRRLQTRKRSEALGLSSLPPDASIEEECQVNIADMSNRCTSTEGALTFFWGGGIIK